MSGGGFPYGHLSNRASAAVSSPITFHHLTVDEIAMYSRMQLVESRGSRGELYRWDFSSFFLKEFIADAPLLRHRIRLLFGVSVEVEPERERNWRRDFADPLYIRAANVQPNEVQSFEMVISKVRSRRRCELFYPLPSAPAPRLPQFTPTRPNSPHRLRPDSSHLV